MSTQMMIHPREGLKRSLARARSIGKDLHLKPGSDSRSRTRLGRFRVWLKTLPWLGPPVPSHSRRSSRLRWRANFTTPPPKKPQDTPHPHSPRRNHRAPPEGECVTPHAHPHGPRSHPASNPGTCLCNTRPTRPSPMSRPPCGPAHAMLAAKSPQAPRTHPHDLVRRLHLEVLYDPLRSIHCVSVLLLEVWCSPAGLYRFLGAVSASLFAVRVCSVVREGGSLLCRSIVRESILTVLVMYRACWLAVIAMVGCAVAASLILLVWSLAMPVVLARVRVPPSRDSEMIMSVCYAFSMSWCIVSRSASGVVGRSLHMCSPSVDAWACSVSAVTSIQIRVFPG
jgi:hypothetical protein